MLVIFSLPLRLNAQDEKPQTCNTKPATTYTVLLATVGHFKFLVIFLDFSRYGKRVKLQLYL
jgi:hypothetical protein